MKKRWVVLPQKSKNITEQLLIARKIKKEDWSSFLKPDFENDLLDPYLIKNMPAVVYRIQKAIKNREIIGLFGDYDADGIPGTALLFETLKLLECQVEVYIPTREQGYGLNKEGIDALKKRGVSLIITIDLGIRNFQEIEYAQNKNLDVIIIDHHEQGPINADELSIDPKQKGDKYPFKELAATGVVFKLIQALSEKFHQITESYLKWSLDLVAISTICDVVPLVFENRVFAKYGLMVLRKTKRIGLNELYKCAAIDSLRVDTYSVGFQIGPRLNAPGRMGNANESFHLLVSKEKKDAKDLANKLDKVNRQRQAELERVLNEAREKVCKNGLDKKKLILVDGKNWPHGIIGLVAGKLMEEFARPVIVCERRKNELRGSARSIDAYNIIEALDFSKQYLIRYGGHKKAAGLSFEQEHQSNLYDKLLELAESKLKDEDLMPKITIDAKLNLKDLNLGLVDKVKQFEPFGLGNPRPIFVLENAKIHDIRTVGQQNQHLKFKVENIGAIGFDLGFWQNELSEGDLVDLVFTVDEDCWDGNRKIQLKILDLKKSDEAGLRP